jgi:septal ring factor EnvC (AmiA/AmiB activator)
MKTTYCSTCNVEILLSEETYNNLLNTGHYFYCLNGHSNMFVYDKQSKLEEELEQFKKALEYHRSQHIKYSDYSEELEKKISGYKGMLKRLQNEIKRLKDK